MNRKNGSGFAFRSIILIFAILVMSIASVSAQEAKVTHYVALGDSLTAGYEPWMKEAWEVDPNTSIIPYGFVERVYEQALYQGRTEFENYGIIGLTTAGFYNFMKAVEASEVIAADQLQERILDPRTNDILAKASDIRKAITKADLITITIGANDFLDLYDLYQTKSEAELQTIVEERLQLYTENLSQSLELIFTLNADVRIVIADQYQPFPKLAGPDIYAKLIEYRKQFTTALELVVKNIQKPADQLQVAYIAERFQGFELAYLNINLTDQTKTDLHPKQKGYEAMAMAFTEVLWGDYKVVTTKDPIGIVVKGNELVTPFKPIVENGTTYVPVREYVEALGGTVEWDQATNSAFADFNGIIVKYTANSNIIVVNGQEKQMGAFVKLIKLDPNDVNSKTYVPLRALAEDGLQLDVKYIQKSNTAYINP